MRRKILAAFLAVLCASTVLFGVTASATSPIDAPTLRQTSNGGQVQINCLTVGFTDCSIAVAFALGGCVSLPVAGTQCLNFWTGAPGGASATAVAGGGATGVVNGRATNCSWIGMSGGCLKPLSGGGLGCGRVSTSGIGHINVNPALLSGGLVGPRASASSTSSCFASVDASLQHAIDAAVAENPQAEGRSDESYLAAILATAFGRLLAAEEAAIRNQLAPVTDTIPGFEEVLVEFSTETLKHAQLFTTQVAADLVAQG